LWKNIYGSILFEDKQQNPTLLKISCYKGAPKTHGAFKCDKCAPKKVIS
jgi:hypothetical protein